MLDPEQPLALHPAKVEPFAGKAVNVTVVPRAKSAVQLALQFEIPPGELLTVPLPVPMFVTLSEAVLGGAVKLAETVCAAFMTMTQEPVPVQPPDQPENVEPPVALAVRVTELPVANSAAHALPQLMPAGVLVTMPLPVLFIVNSSGGEEDGGGSSVPGVGDGVDESSEPEQADKKRNSIHAPARM